MPDKFVRKLRTYSIDAEQRLWNALRSRQLAGFKFRRQHPLGAYIVDFVCLDRALIIEADGGQHADSAADVKRTRWLEDHGWRLLRLWNNEITENLDGVLSTILAALKGEA